MGQEFLEDDERPKRPVEVIMEDKVALVEEVVLSNRRLWSSNVYTCNDSDKHKSVKLWCQIRDDVPDDV
nr:unnamed protein product [Callosobruchus analis]